MMGKVHSFRQHAAQRAVLPCCSQPHTLSAGCSCCAEVIKYLTKCGEFCAHIHILPVFHLSLPMHNSHHGSFGRGIEESAIDCRCELLGLHACATS